MFGLNSLIFHVTNIALHLTCVLLLHSTCSSTLNMSPGVSLLASLLFTVHPVHCEAVSIFILMQWSGDVVLQVSSIVGRADVLAAISMLTTFQLGAR